MNTSIGRWARWLRFLPLLLLLAGVVLLALAWSTPPYSDAAGLQAELDRINATYDYDDHDAMSAAFYAALDRFETSKWLLADLGYSFLAWAGLGGAVVLLAMWRGWTVVTHTHRNPLLIGVLVIALVLMGVGLVASGAHPLAREQIPWWADSFGIHLFSVAVAMTLFAPIMLVWSLIGFVRRGQRVPLIARPARPYWVPVLTTLLFLPPLICSLLMLVSFGTEGAWALSPAGGLLTWLLLNSRALILAPRAA